MAVDIGKLNKRVTFWKPKTIRDSMMQKKVIWETYKTLWATVTPYKSSEVSFMSKLKPSVSHRLYIRYRDDITTDMRVQYRGRTFEIAGPPVDMEERHEMLEIQLEEVFEGEKFGF